MIDGQMAKWLFIFYPCLFLTLSIPPYFSKSPTPYGLNILLPQSTVINLLRLKMSKYKTVINILELHSFNHTLFTHSFLHRFIDLFIHQFIHSFHLTFRLSSKSWRKRTRVCTYWARTNPPCRSNLTRSTKRYSVRKINIFHII